MASIAYRKDLDGLRCVAVLAIVLFHASPPSLPGGFVGVDVFFVLSGFLITSIIVTEIGEDRFSLLRFYGRRIRRLFPALALVLAATLAAGWFMLSADDYLSLGRQTVAGAAFYANFHFWGASGYFDASTQTMPLLHLWSLGVEEQFYVVWPLTLWAILRMRVRPLWVLGLLTAASFAFCLYVSDGDPDQAFYSPFSRLWQLSLGGVVATLPPSAAGARERSILSAAGLLLILLSCWLIDPGQPVPGVNAAMPTLGAALLIRAGPEAFVNRLLSIRPAVAIGRTSYPLYLWHWPLLSFAWINADLADPSRLARGAMAVVAFIAAWATWRWVERPMKPVHPLKLAALLLAVAFAALLVIWSGGVPQRAVNQDPRRAFVARQNALRFDDIEHSGLPNCGFMEWRSSRIKDMIDPRCTLPGRRGTYFLWGDSHAHALVVGMIRAVPQGISIARVASPGCAVDYPDTGRAPGSGRQGKRACRRSNDFAAAAVRRLKPDIVFLAQASGHQRSDWDALARSIRALGARRVVLVGPVPQWRPSLPLVIARAHWPFTEDYIATGLDRSILSTDALLHRRYDRSRDLTYLSLIDRLCDARGCRARLGDGLTSWDYGHLTAPASEYVARDILTRLGLPTRRTDMP